MVSKPVNRAFRPPRRTKLCSNKKAAWHNLAQVTRDRYTFGDTNEATERLRRLAELYEPETRELLQRGDVRTPPLAIDLGCGPGWSTRLLQETLNPRRTIGFDISERYVAEARRLQNSNLEFQVHDITRAPFPVAAPNVLFCRFLLTHLSALDEVLKTWATISAPRSLLFVHETESLNTDHPILRRYYELVAQLQHRYGQTLLVGSLVEGCLKESGWRVVESRRLDLQKPISKMAQLHLPNLRTWRHDDYARRAFDDEEIDLLETSLREIAEGSLNEPTVINGARQIIAQRQ